MRLSSFNAFAAPVAFGAQRPVARAVRFGETNTTNVQKDKDPGYRDTENAAWVEGEKNRMTAHRDQQLGAAAEREQEEKLKTNGQVDDEED